MRGRYFFVFVRVLIGMVYIISGAEKLLQPYENFLYIVEEYDIIPFAAVERVIAATFPWLEYFLGGFLILGLWTRECLACIGMFSCVFIIVVGQAIVRGLPLAECGCFGDLVGMSLTATFIIDIIILLLVILCLCFYRKGTILWSLDRYWE